MGGGPATTIDRGCTKCPGAWRCTDRTVGHYPRGRMCRSLPLRPTRPFPARKPHMSHMTPSEIVSELDKHIVGQDAAKRAVAIALRNRWRRQQVAEPLRQEITPKN